MFRPLKVLSTYRRLNRYREVVFILLKYGFDDIVDRIVPEIFFWRSLRRSRRKRSHLPTAARIRQALVELGPTYIKFGQLLSTRPDIIPANFIAELEKLQDEVAPFEISEVRRIFSEELNADPHELFESFSETPFASGSVAQVHKARLHSGERVAVKVQRPRIRRIIETDLVILQEIMQLIERQVPELRPLRPTQLVDQFANTIRRELDFIAEGHAAERFRSNFERDSSYFVPRVFWEHTTGRVLTIEFVDGVKITDFREIEKRGYDKKAIARNGARAILREVFEHRFFHADPHPGNFFVLENNAIAAVDFGIVGRLDEETAEHLGALVSALINQDVEKVARVFRHMGILDERIDVGLLKFDLMEFIDRYHGLPLEKIEAEQMIEDLLQIFRRHRILLPVNLALIGKMLVVAAGVGRMLDPGFDLVGEARPFVEAFMRRRYDPRRRLRQVGETIEDYGRVVRSIPGDLQEILAKMKKGKMLVSLHHEGLNRFILEMDRSSNRLAFGMIVASLIVGSSVVMQLERGPMLYGFSVLGLGGFLIAGILGLWLVIAILRSGRI